MRTAPTPKKRIRLWEGVFDEGLRDSTSSEGEIRAQGRFLRHPKTRKGVQSASVSKLLLPGEGVFET